MTAKLAFFAVVSLSCAPAPLAAMAAKPRAAAALLAPALPTPPAAVEAPPGPRAAHWLDEPEHKAPGAPASGFGYFAVGTLVLLLSVGGMIVLIRRNPTALGASAAKERIDLLAVRSLGGRQKLCLIETLGERLLIAVGESDATLISHMPGGQLPTAAEAEAEIGLPQAPPALEPTAYAAVASRASRTPPVPQPAPQTPQAPAAEARWMPPAPEVFRAPSSGSVAQTAAHAPPGSHADVAGLSRWRGEAAAERGRS